MEYGRNLDGTDLPDDGTEQYQAIPLEDGAEAVRADVTVSGTFNAGSADFNLYVWDDKGDLREVTDGDNGDFTQLGSTFSVTDTNPHDIGAAFRAEDYGFAILGMISSGDATGLSVDGDFIADTHEDAEDSPIGHATGANATEDVYTDGTAQ